MSDEREEMIEVGYLELLDRLMEIGKLIKTYFPDRLPEVQDHLMAMGLIKRARSTWH